MGARRYAIGDAQTSFARFREVLASHDLLGSDGTLEDDVFLVSIGDYFDYGAADERSVAAENGLSLLAWLASHSPEQVVIVAGNHDLGRVGELAGFSDSQFARAHAQARVAYESGDAGGALEAELLREFPALPTAEIAARDFSAFTVAQRELVVRLLRERRLCLAHASDDMLFCHAGITKQYLAALGLAGDAEAQTIASELNRRLYDAFDSRQVGPLVIPSIHSPGNSTIGEGVGMLYHRPANPGEAVNAAYNLGETMSRRYDARDIPSGLTQVVGHISDKKCRQLLGKEWTSAKATRPGALRSMVASGQKVTYGPGLPESKPDHGAMIFIDGGMNRVATTEYELFRF